MPTCKILAIGDELLLGIRVNSNLTYLGAELNRHGIDVNWACETRDDTGEIKESFGCALKQADIVITTGGLGPTVDDLTRESVAEALGVKLVINPRQEERIHERLRKLGRQAAANNLRQAQVLEGAEVLDNDFGTAPGQYYKRDGKVAILLPGPQSELKPILQKEVLPRLERDGFLQRGRAYLQLRCFGIAESTLDEQLAPIFEPYGDDLRVAYCAHNGVIDCRLSSENDALSGDEIFEIGQKVRDIMGEDFFAYGHIDLPQLLLERLRMMDKTLSIAESCTGGLLSNSLTDIPGASKVFKGGVVCYTNEAKMEMLGVPESILEQHGAVSAETAHAMACGASERFGSDYALSVTGFAGPGGGTHENPVGTIFLGYCSPYGSWSRRVVYPGNRITIKERAVLTALDWMRRKTQKYLAQDLGPEYSI